MTWFQKKTPTKPTTPPVERVRERGGFKVGQVVQHKVTGKKAVIVAFDPAAPYDVTVSIGWYRDDEFGCALAEIEAWTAPVKDAS